MSNDSRYDKYKNVPQEVRAALLDAVIAEIPEDTMLKIVEDYMKDIIFADSDGNDGIERIMSWFYSLIALGAYFGSYEAIEVFTETMFGKN